MCMVKPLCYQNIFLKKDDVVLNIFFTALKYHETTIVWLICSLNSLYQVKLCSLGLCLKRSDSCILEKQDFYSIYYNLNY